MSKVSIHSLFAMDDYRPYLRAWAQAKGRGELGRLASALRIHTTRMSQVLGGSKSLTQEQAARLAEYMGLNALESDYVLKLVQLDRAGTEDLKRIHRRHLAQLRAQANEAKSRVPESREMSEQDRAIFYSSWQYAAIRLLTSTGCRTAPEISVRLAIPLKRVRSILEFLCSRGLCRESRSGEYVRTEKNTHVEARSPLAVRHHQNWRSRSVELQERAGVGDLSFTAPVSVSRRDVGKIRELLLDAIATVAKAVEKSPSEEVVYLGIDWIRI